MPEPNAIANIGDLAKPATVLIEKISDAVGGICRPFQIKRVAKAEAQATILRAKTTAESDILLAKNSIEVTDLHRRAMHRFIEEEANKQDNMESITEKTLPQLDGNADPSKVDDDWITNFFDKCRIVSDGEMQQLWSKVLAGESNSPGTYSKRTVNFISSLDKDDAQKFTAVCRFIWGLGDHTP